MLCQTLTKTTTNKTNMKLALRCGETIKYLNLDKNKIKIKRITLLNPDTVFALANFHLSVKEIWR